MRAGGARGGPPVLLIHGASGSQIEWRDCPLSRDLARDHCLIAYDRPGLGDSARHDGDWRLERQALAARRALERFKARPAVVVGHSFGGAVALRLALEARELVAGLVLLCPASHPWPGETAWYNRAAATPFAGAAFARLAVPLVGAAQGRALGRQAVEKIFHPDPVPAAYPDPVKDFRAFEPRVFKANGEDLAAANREFAAQEARYGEIEAPAALLQGTEDRVLDGRIHAKALARVMPRARLVKLEGAGHMPHWTEPDVAARRVRALSGVGASADGSQAARLT